MQLIRVASIASLFVAAVASAQPADPYEPPPCLDPCEQSHAAAKTPAPPRAATTEPVTPPTTPATPPPAVDDEGGWHAPAGKRFASGFRLGWMYLNAIDKVEMDRADAQHPMGQSIGQQFGLKSANMFVIGYEGFYRIIGHSWLNVLLVGNVSVAGLEQSKFIPTASGLLGFEFDRSFQLGVGVNVTPDPAAVSHMIIAAGWTPMVGSIQTPLHGFFIPDPDGNYRIGATVGMNW